MDTSLKQTRGQVIDTALIAMTGALKTGQLTLNDLVAVMAATAFGIKAPKTWTWPRINAELQNACDQGLSRETLERQIAETTDESAKADLVRKSQDVRSLLVAVRDALWHAHLTPTRVRVLLDCTIAKNIANGQSKSVATRQACEWTFWEIAAEATAGRLPKGEYEELVSEIRVVAIKACTEKCGGDQTRGYAMAVTYLQELEQARRKEANKARRADQNRRGKKTAA